MYRKRALFIGAHPDDIEIGVGGTLAKLCQENWEVWALVLTSDENSEIAIQRKRETSEALQLLGVRQTNILFADFKDGYLKNNKDTVSHLRKISREANILPDVIFTHSDSDAHSDHKVANQLIKAAFRKVVLLCYAVINHLVVSEFNPKFFINISSYDALKYKALQSHQSQISLNRILFNDIDRFHTKYKTSIGKSVVEAFEIVIPEGVGDALTLITELNDSSFHKLWHLLIKNRQLTLIHSTPIHREVKEGNWEIDKDRDGQNILLNNFHKYGYFKNQESGVKVVRHNNEEAIDALKTSDILLSGGAVSNLITRNHYNYFVGIRYVIQYNMPDFKNIHILDRQKNERLYATYSGEGFKKQVLNDVGILTIIKNPYNLNRYLIAVMGIHGFGTLGAYSLLYDPQNISKLLDIILTLEGNDGFQVLVNYNTQHKKTEIRSESLQIIKSSSHLLEKMGEMRV